MKEQSKSSAPFFLLSLRTRLALFDKGYCLKKQNLKNHKGDTKNGLQQTGIRNARTKQR